MEFYHILNFLVLSFLVASRQANGAVAEERLQKYLFQNYNKHIRPSKVVSDVVEVNFILTLLQLISVAEKSEEMTTSQYITLQWNDSRLTWNPKEFDGIQTVRVPSKIIWKPDIALKNNIDGKYDKSLPVNAILKSSGRIEWMPPAIYKSSCSIQVEYFPFDWQNCTLSFRSFSYSPREVRLTSLYDKIVVDKEAYTDNGEWNVIHCPIKINWDQNDPDYQDITLYLIIQRKPMFYIINIIVPCVLISSLSVLVFYLPSGCSEKMNMSISVLLGLPVYLLLLAKRVPETSLGVPLIGSYLLFTMLSVTCSVVFSVFVLNVHHRSPATNTMKPWVRSLFIDFLSPLLYINQPIIRGTSNSDSKFNTSRQYENSQPMRNEPETDITEELRRPDNSELDSPIGMAQERLFRKRKIGRFQPLERRRRKGMQTDLPSGSMKPENLKLVPRVTSIHSTNLARREIRGVTQHSRRATYHLPTDSDSCNKRDTPNLTTFFSPNTFQIRRSGHYSERFTGSSSPAVSSPRPQATSITSSLNMSSLEDIHHENEIVDVIAPPGISNSKNSPDDIAPAFREYFLLSCDRKREVFKTSKCTLDKEEAISGSRSIANEKQLNNIVNTSVLLQAVPSENIRQEQVSTCSSKNVYKRYRGQQYQSCDFPTKHMRAVTLHSRHGGSRSLESSRTESHLPVVQPRKKPETVTRVIHCLPMQTNECLDAVNFICQHLRSENEYKEAVQEWHMVAMVLERLMFWIFLFIYVTGSFYFAVQALTNYPPEHPFMTGDPKYSRCWTDKDELIFKSKWNPR